uniref:Uncharacterized protein n=1 Tax=Anopheles arabiensis TaxID=7173 RepID=A0A182IG64_ANOAR
MTWSPVTKCQFPRLLVWHSISMAQREAD